MNEESTGPAPPSRSDQIRNFLWFVGIAALLALALVLWIRKSARSPLTDVSPGDVPAQSFAVLASELQTILESSQGGKDDQERQQRGREAIVRVRQMIAESPGFLPARRALAGLAVTLGDQQTAKEAAESFVNDYPDHPAARMTLGLVRQSSGDYAAAEKEFRESIRLLQQRGAENQRWEPHGLLAELYLRQGRTDLADAELKEAIQINVAATAIQIARSSLELSQRLGMLLVTSERPEESAAAWRLLTGVARHRQDDAEAQYWAAFAAARRGDAESAREFLRRSEQLRPADPRYADLRKQIERLPPATQPTQAGPAATSTAPVSSTP